MQQFATSMIFSRKLKKSVTFLFHKLLDGQIAGNVLSVICLEIHWTIYYRVQESDYTSCGTIHESVGCDGSSL